MEYLGRELGHRGIHPEREVIGVLDKIVSEMHAHGTPENSSICGRDKFRT